MGIIIASQHGTFIRDVSRPVGFAYAQGSSVLLAVRDAAKIFQVDDADVARAADAGATVSTHVGDVQFWWPELAVVKKEWPDYPVQELQTHVAHPCTIHYRTPGANGRDEYMDTRSMRAARLHLGLSERDFETIVHRLPGWRSLLPPCVVGIKVHEPGYELVNPEPLSPDALADSHAFFRLSARKHDYRMDVVDGSPQFYASLRDIPDFVLNHAQWA